MFDVPKELKALKITHGRVDWKIQKERRKFLNQVYLLIGKWKGPFPNLRDIFTPEEIESLLVESLKGSKAKILIEFVIKTGYEDEPIHDAHGKPLLRRTTPLHHAAKSKIRYNFINELFKIYNKFDVNYTDESGLTHFHVACMTGCEYAVKKFLEFGLDPIFCWPKIGESPLQIAQSKNHRNIVRLLLRKVVDLNSADADGSTHLHIICKRPGNYDLARMLFEICDEVNKTVLVNAQDTFGNTPLLLALQFTGRREQEMTAMLLRRGANLNLANNDGLTPLHMICQKEWAFILVKFINDQHPRLQVNAQDQFGNTPLHVALAHHCKKLAKLLLENGPDLNLTNAEGLTPLHFICIKNYDAHYVMKFFEIDKKANRPIQVDKQDNLGNTALHFALGERNKKMVVSLLLENGANPNLANAEGSTALHVICNRKYDEDLLLTFFRITKKMNQPVQVDARDGKGRTPLRLAVANLWPEMFTALLDNGADLSNFDFPTASDFDEFFEPYKSHKSRQMERFFGLKVEIISDTYSIIKSLEENGYDLFRSDALTMMAFFAEHGLSEIPLDLDDSRLNRQTFVIKAKEIKIKPNLSLYDLIQLRPAQASKLQFTIIDFLITRYSFENFSRNVCELIDAKISPILLRRFFCNWGLELIIELIHQRLPVLCCEMIVDGLTNTDLHNICLAATGQN